MTDAKPCTDLTFATDQELAVELLSRFSNCLIVGEYELKNDSNKLGIGFWWTGGWTAALGLARRTIIQVESEVNRAPPTTGE